MLTKTTEAHAPLLAALLGSPNTSPPSNAHATENGFKHAPLAEDLFTLRMRAAFRCYGAAHPSCAFYLAAPSQEKFEAQQVAQVVETKESATQKVPLQQEADVREPSPPHGVLCVQGRSALYSGGLHDAEELETFLGFLQVETFQSNSMLLPGWKPVPQYLMHLPAGEAVHLCAAPVDEQPDLWALAHSGVLTDIDPDVWYADVCARVKSGIADVRAIAVPVTANARAADTQADSTNKNAPQYAATAGAYAIDAKGVYLTALQTREAYRGRGFGCTLLSSLACAYGDRDKWLLCKPALHGFYEQLGFVLARPVCEYQAPRESCCRKTNKKA